MATITYADFIAANAPATRTNLGVTQVRSTRANVGPVTVTFLKDEVREVTLVFDATNYTTVGNEVTIGFEMSTDGGASWVPWVRTTRPGGACTDGVDVLGYHHLTTRFTAPQAGSFQVRMFHQTNGAQVNMPAATFWVK